MLGWKTITFNYRDAASYEVAKQKAEAWRQRHERNYQIVTIYVHNAFGFEYRRKLKIL